MLLSFAAVIAGLLLLIWSADRFVDGASLFARIAGLSPLLVGILIVGFGTSAPEMLVASIAALEGNSGLGIGNAIGSNISNIALILGITAIIVPLSVKHRVVKVELPLVLGAGVLAFALLWDGTLGRMDGIILMLTLFAVMSFLTYLALQRDSNPIVSSSPPPANSPIDTSANTGKNHSEQPSPSEVKPEVESEEEVQGLKYALFWTMAGLVLLIVSSKLLVWGAVNIAQTFGISDLIIGLTIIAIGTSLPELAASIISARKQQVDMAVGNVVGSNLFNTLGVLALPGLLRPDSVPVEALQRDFPIMLGITLLLLIFSLGYWQRYRLTRWKGMVLFALFIVYEIILYLQATA
ncbi:MAG: calcium/sodium antiporter [bacterium]